MRHIATLLIAGLVVPAAVSATHAATFDGDNYGDIFYVSNGTLYWLESNGANNTVTANYSANGSVSSHGWKSVAVGNVDGNGKMDLFVSRQVAENGSSGLNWYEWDGTDNSLTYRAVAANYLVAANGLATGDIDNDGKGNIFMGSAANNGVKEMEYSGSDDAFNAIRSITSSGGANVSIGMGQFDSNGYMDIFAGRNDNLTWYEATGSDDAAPGYLVPRGGFSDLKNVKDIAVAPGNLFVIDSSGKVNWYTPGGGNALTGRQTDIDGNGDATAVAFGDVDGDGVNELLVGHANGVKWYELNTSTNQYVQVSGTNFGTAGIDDLVIVPAAVPEPGTLSVLAAGGLLMIRRRRRA